ncbi:MAG: hypothetical protein ACXVGD_06120 [Blastococcus sp.]
MVGNRTADTAMSAFAGDPQPVEIHHRGIWYSGELLGWRHESDGRVVARVRCVVDRLRHSTWKDLTELRLPDPRRPPRAEVFPAARATPEDDDSTRPHVLMSALRTRPQAPDHARTPPARTAGRPAPGLPAWATTTPAPLEHIPDEGGTPERRRMRRDLEPELSAV